MVGSGTIVCANESHTGQILKMQARRVQCYFTVGAKRLAPEIVSVLKQERDALPFADVREVAQGIKSTK